MKKLVMLLCAVVMWMVSFAQQPNCQDFTIVPNISGRWNADENRFEACSNLPIEISANGVFPNNDAPNGYHQSDESLNWTWSWVD